MLIRDYVDAFIPHTIELNCAYCHKDFSWFCSDINENSSYNRPKYCSTTHKTSAKRRRNNNKLKGIRKSVTIKCPTPEKRNYGSRDEALKIIDNFHYGDDHIRPYLCVCGVYHNGHSLKGSKKSVVA